MRSIILLLTAVAVGCSTDTGTPSGAHSSLTFIPASIKFGSIVPGAELAQDVLIKNQSEQPINVIKIDASCGCTTPELSASSIPPGAQATLKVRLHAPDDVKAFRHTIWLSTDRREEPYALAIAGRTEWPLVASPESLHFGTLAVGETVTRRVEFLSVTSKAYQVDSGMDDDPRITIAKIIESPLRNTFDVTLGPCDEPGLVATKVMFQTTCPERSTVGVGVSCDVVDHATTQLKPSRVLISGKPAGSLCELKFVIQGAATVEHVDLATALGEQQDWNLEGWNQNDRILHVRVTPPPAAGFRKAKLRVRFKRGSNEVVVPVSFLSSGP